MDPARRCAYAVLRRVFEQGAYADRALDAEAQRLQLDGRQRAFATALAYGAVQRRATLDDFIARLADRPVGELDAHLVAALRLGLIQLVYMGGVPDHAAVDESVELAKSQGSGTGLVNAVLRRAAREREALLDELDDSTPEGAAIAHSHPEWVARLWWDLLGAGEARALMAADNRPAENSIRVNTLAGDIDTVTAALAKEGLVTHPAEDVADGLVLEGPFDAHGSALWRAGAFTPQSRASMAVAHVLDPRPGEHVLDLCAAPGAKATHLAALMAGEGEVHAVERNPQRAEQLKAMGERMRAANVRVHEGDARHPPGEGYDRVLIDPPCSGLGTLRSRPDLRWRASADAVAELAALQAEILAAGARALRPGGTLVYSTCTISPAENERVVETFLAGEPEFAADDLHSDYPLWKHPVVARHLQTLPHRDGTDGFFIARLRRSGEAA